MSTRVEELRDLAVRTRVGGSAFAEWAARFAGCPSNPESLVYDVDAVDDHFGVLTTWWEGRRARWQRVPCNARERVSPPPITESMIDPWTVDERELRACSEHIASCDHCGGTGKATCGPCRGTGTLVCETCNGERKQYGYASNGAYRLLNCTTCRGKGEVDCPECRRGIATCNVCAGEKRIQGWIAIERWQRTSTSEYPRSAGVQGHLAATIEQPRALTRPDLGNVSNEWLERLTSGPAQPGERIARQELRITRAPRLVVYFRVGDAEETVEFAGSQLVPLQATAPASFTARARRLRLAFGALVTLGCVAALLYLSRGLFYWNRWSFAAIASLALSFALLYRAIAEHTGARRHTTRWLNASFAALLLMLVFGFIARPAASHVHELIAADHLEAAQIEMRALGSADEALADEMIAAEAMRKVRTGDCAGAAALLETLHDRSRGRVVVDAIRAEAERKTKEANALTFTEQRLRARRTAEELWSISDRLGEVTAQAQLVELRTAMARDILELEGTRP